LNNFLWYLLQQSLKSGGIKDHFRDIKVPGTTLYCKAGMGYDKILLFMLIIKYLAMAYPLCNAK
jgi:hypothetical protein